MVEELPQVVPLLVGMAVHLQLEGMVLDCYNQVELVESQDLMVANLNPVESEDTLLHLVEVGRLLVGKQGLVGYFHKDLGCSYPAWGLVHPQVDVVLHQKMIDLFYHSLVPSYDRHNTFLCNSFT